MTSPKPRLTQGPVGRQLVGMTVPVFFGIFMMMLQSFVDMWFIGKVGDRELAALSFGFPIIMIVSSVAIGLGAGTSSVVARAIGADSHRRARRLSTDSLILSFLVTAVISVIGVLTITPLFRLLGAPNDMIPLIGGYMRILYAGVPFIVVVMVGIATMRATGDTRLPGLLMVLASIINIVLDPVLIFGLGPVPTMGLNGAALAALLSRAVIFAGVVYLMRYRLDFLTFNRPDPAELVQSWKSILHVGIPAAGTNAIIPIATGVITAMLAKYGPETVAGFGVASRIESLTLVFFYALSAIIGPFVGQNIAANRADRIFRALWLCTVFCISFGLVMAAVLAAIGDWLPTLFSEHDQVVAVAATFLMIVPISYGTYGMVMVMNASFNGMGKPMPAVHISVGRMVVIYLPLAFLLDRWFGVAGIFVAYMVANVVTGIVSYAWARASVQPQCEAHAVPAAPVPAETVQS